MTTCPYYNTLTPVTDVSTASEMKCQHRCADKATQVNPSCDGRFSYCNVRLDDRQLSDFLHDEVRSKRADLVTHAGEHEVGIMVEKNTWLASELTRRFGQRQSRGVESLFKTNSKFLKFASDTMPMNFGEFIIFPLEPAKINPSP